MVQEVRGVVAELADGVGGEVRVTEEEGAEGGKGT